MIIDVYCEDDSIQIAKIIDDCNECYNVIFLEETTKGIYNFSTEIISIPKESVSGFYDVENLEETGIYSKIPNGYELYDEDEDFICDSESDTETESECDSECDEDELI